MMLEYGLLLCRLIVLFTFLVAFVGKARDLTLFRETITAFDVIPRGLGQAAALGIIGNELLIILFLIMDKPFLVWGFLLGLVWLTMFMVLLTTALIRKSRVACNCFGAGQNRISIFDVIRNGMLVG